MHLSKIQKYWLHLFSFCLPRTFFFTAPGAVSGSREKTTAALLRTLRSRRQKSHWLPGGRSNRPHPIRRRRKDDPNNASSGASGQRADTAGRSHKHASAPYLLCLPPPERREPTRVSPRITLQEKAGGGDWLLAGTNKVHSDLVKRRSHSASVSSHC